MLSYKEIQQANVETGEKDLQLFRTWKKTKLDSDKQKVLEALMPIIMGECNKYSASGLSKDIIRMKARSLAYNALNKFIDNGTAKLSTFIKIQLQPLHRFVNQSKDTVRVPEHIGLETRKFLDSYYMIKERHDHEPAIQDLCKELNWKEKKVNKFLSLMFPEVLDMTVFSATSDDLSKEDSRLKNAIAMYIPMLSGNETEIFKDMIGFGKTTHLSNPELIHKYSLTQSQVSTLKKKFSKGMKDILSRSIL
jgi:DNA-directed RNA polymerase specialized sigma subunit